MNRKQIIMPISLGEETLALHLKAMNIPFEREYRFHPVRKWRFDFLIANTIGVEVEGAIYSNGRHNRGSGYSKDIEKYNEAAIMGFKVLRFTTDMVKSGHAIDTIKRALAQ